MALQKGRWVRCAPWFAALLLATAPGTAGASPEPEPEPADYAKVVERARQAHATYPRASLTQRVDSDDQAYAIQAAVVAERLRHDAIAGFKGGAMRLPSSEQPQPAPIFGVLYRSGRVKLPGELRLSNFRRMVIETEIGFEIGKRITAPVADVGLLKRYVRAIHPAIELPDSALEDRVNASNRELIATNIIAEGFGTGGPVRTGAVDPNAVAVRLYRDGTLISEGRGSECLGDQWMALLWIVNHVLARRGAIEPGALIITGVLGNPIPATAGAFRAEYTGLGEVTFTVRP